MTPTIGRFTRPNGTVVQRAANKTTSLADLVSGLDGNDSINGGGGNDSVSGGNGNDTLIGDTLIGAVGLDTIRGGTGNDAIEGRVDNDRLFGDVGNDTVQGNHGSDTINGGAGNDRLIGDDAVIEGLIDGSSDDVIFGDKGNDTVVGDAYSLVGEARGAGNDTLRGGDGDDSVVGDGGTGFVGDFSAGVGDDALFGEWGNDTLMGDGEDHGAGDDFLNAGPGHDLMFGDGKSGFPGGNDTLILREGSDTAVGGRGEDLFILDEHFAEVDQDGNPINFRDLIVDFEGAGIAGGDVLDITPNEIHGWDYHLTSVVSPVGGNAGAVVQTSDGKGGTLLSIYGDQNAKADWEIVLANVTPGTLTTEDIIL